MYSKSPQKELQDKMKNKFYHQTRNLPT